MYEAGAAVPAQVGITIFDKLEVGSQEAPTGWRHCSAVVPDWLLAKLKPRQQQIGPLETLGGLCAVLSRPQQFEDREVIQFIDNTQALFTLASGSARQVDCARLVHYFQCLCAALRAQVWFEFVASGANIADQPSRGEFDLLDELGSTPFPIRWPDMDASWAGVFDATFREFAPRPSKAEKRARSAVASEIDDERARARRARIFP